MVPEDNREICGLWVLSVMLVSRACCWLEGRKATAGMSEQHPGSRHGEKKKKKEFKEDLRVTINYEINASLDCCSRNNLAALKDPTWNILIRLGPF